MIKISEDRFKIYEQSYPGITEQILRYERGVLPPCIFCGSTDTAVVLRGIIGRTIHLASATSKVKLSIKIGNRHFYCNTCQQPFNLLF